MYGCKLHCNTKGKKKDSWTCNWASAATVSYELDNDNASIVFVTGFGRPTVECDCWIRTKRTRRTKRTIDSRN